MRTFIYVVLAMFLLRAWVLLRFIATKQYPRETKHTAGDDAAAVVIAIVMIVWAVASL